MILPVMIILLNLFRFCSENIENSLFYPDMTDFRYSDFSFRGETLPTLAQRLVWVCAAFQFQVSMRMSESDLIDGQSKLSIVIKLLRCLSFSLTAEVTQSASSFTQDFPGVISYNLTRNNRKDRKELHGIHRLQTLREK